ncbi:MAG: hypothetical protein J6333_07325 [Planctomycetes bacterium]|nr:hypothetical protein [Planctomycetota bacterium]
MSKALRIAAATLLLAVSVTAGAFADTGADFSVEGRGLPQLNGILRDTSKANYGFVNFVAFGPGWQYTAQDYAAKEHKKAAVEDPKLGKGLQCTGKIGAGGTQLTFREEFFDVSAANGGKAKVHVRWTIANVKDGQPMKLERAYVRFPLAINDFGGGKVGDVTLPETYGEEWVKVGDAKEIKIVSKDGNKKLHVSVAAGEPVIQDARKDKQDRLELRINFPNAKDGATSTIEFEMAGAFADALKKPEGKVKLALPPPPLAPLAANADWAAFPYSNAIKEGSILDFANLVKPGAPAGKDGFAKVNKAGHIVFEKAPNKEVRFVGGNLCFDANFLSKEQCQRAVTDFVRRGWNTIRFHHIDVTITKDEWNGLWNRKTWPEISPAKLDQLDYLLAECKKAGIYVTFDLYAMGALGSCEGFDKPLNSNTIKAIVPIHKPAEDQWFKRAMEIFDHVNPYTGLKWKDDPAILFVTLMNEDSIASVWWGAADVYVKKYNEWAKGKGYPEYPAKDIGKKKEFAEFLYHVKAEANRRMGKRLKDAGVKALISGGNWWDNAAQVYEREALEIVDNYGYGDHPQPSYQKLPFHINQSSNIKSGAPSYNEPMMKAPTRILGKPFAITEYNYCPPSRLRGEGGMMMGAYAALQDWDAIYRFAWSQSRAGMFGDHQVSGFDICRDPIGQLTERQVVLMFGRRDVAPAKEVYGYGVTKDEAFNGGLGDMWAKGLFPHPFTQLGYTSRIGSYVADGDAKPALACAKSWTAATKKELPKYNGKTVSDTKEITVNTVDGDMTVNTPKTAAVCSTVRHDLTAGPLSVTGATTFCSVSASAMDGAELTKSKKVLILHITNVLNTGMAFTNPNMTDTKNWGKLPYLARVGSANVKLANANPGLKVYALASDGTRLRAVKADYVGGAYAFTVAVAAGEGENAPTMIYELGQ